MLSVGNVFSPSCGPKQMECGTWAEMFPGMLSSEQLRKQEEAVDERWWMIVGDNGPEM